MKMFENDEDRPFVQKSKQSLCVIRINDQKTEFQSVQQFYCVSLDSDTVILYKNCGVLEFIKV